MDFSKVKKWMGKMNFILDAYAEEEAFTITEKNLLLDYCKKIEEQIRALETLEGSELPITEEAKPINLDGDNKNTSIEAPVNEILPPVEKPFPVLSDMANYEEIFESKSGKDLSDKLESLPITDIKKAMGLNERILTQNELFGANAQVFDEAIHFLNQCGSMDAAKGYLSEHIIPKFDWMHKDRIKKAQIFIKLIKRRY